MILGGNYAIQNQLNVTRQQHSSKSLPQMSQARGQYIKWCPGNVQVSHGAKCFGRPILKGSPQQTNHLLQNKDMLQIDGSKNRSMQSKEIHLDGNIHVPLTISQMQQLPFLQQEQEQANRLPNTDLHRQQMHIHSSLPTQTGLDITESSNFIKNSGSLTPTQNQLAQWFSPELLAKASAGKLPHLNMNKAVILQEFERNMPHSSTIALN